jgi:hypothetical protein
MTMAKPLPAEWRTDQIPQELADLKAQLCSLPHPMREKLLPLCDRLSQYTRLQHRLVRIAQDAVDQLQLDVKYLLFDLEVTRRERDDLMREMGGMEGEGN